MVRRDPYALLLSLLLATTLGVGSVRAQPVSVASSAWNTILVHAGVHFTYVFHREANNTHNGVVLMLTNTNDHAVKYRFRIVFRSGGREVTEAVRGELQAGERKTGSEAGLFWIPFTEGAPLEEVGLRDYRIERSNG